MSIRDEVIVNQNELLESLKKSVLELSFENAAQAQEIERLKGLIKEGFIILQQHWGKTVGQIDKDWKKFKSENNL